MEFKHTRSKGVPDCLNNIAGTTIFVAAVAALVVAMIAVDASARVNDDLAKAKWRNRASMQ